MSRRQPTRIGDCRKSVDTLVSALDPLSAAAHTALRAAWWTRSLRQAFVTAPYDATHLYDQSGNSKDLLSGASIGTTSEGHDTALMLSANALSRSDALGLAADPALTIAFRARFSGDLTTFPTLLSMGTSGSSEFSLFAGDDGATAAMSISNFDGSFTVSFDTPVGTLAGWHNYVLTKSAGSGYANTWRLYIDGVSRGVPGLVAGTLALGATLFQLGDFDGGGFPFVGNLAGLLVFESVLTGADLARVQAL